MCGWVHVWSACVVGYMCGWLHEYMSGWLHVCSATCSTNHSKWNIQWAYPLYPLIEKGSLVGESPNLQFVNVHLHDDNDYILTIIHIAYAIKVNLPKHSYRHMSSPLMGLVFQFRCPLRIQTNRTIHRTQNKPFP